MKYNKWHNGLLLLAAGLLVGCSADSTEQSVPDDAPKEIKIHVTDIASQTDATRATIINNNTNLQSQNIRIDAYYHGTTTAHLSEAKLRYSSSWGFVDGSGNAISCFWPIEGSVHATAGMVSSLDFVGYAPYTKLSYIGTVSYTAANGPSFTCTNLPVTSAGQAAASLQEFLYAYATDQDYADQVANSGIPLEFQHPFAKITLQLKTSHRAIYNLNTIKFKSIKNNGTFTYGNNPQWTTTGSTTDFTITVNEGIGADADFTSGQITAMNFPLIVLPQSLIATDQIEVKLTWNSGDSESTYTFDNPVSTWQSGKSYNYTLDLLGDIKFSVTIDDWVEEDTKRNLRF